MQTPEILEEVLETQEHDILEEVVETQEQLDAHTDPDLVETTVKEEADKKSGFGFGFTLPEMPDIPGGASFKALSVLDTGIKMRMNPMQMSKAGVVIKNMQGAAYTDEQINCVCRALFLDQCEEDMREAWLVFAKEGQEALDAAEFRKVHLHVFVRCPFSVCCCCYCVDYHGVKALPLMGEDVPEERITELFQIADEANSSMLL